jgi:hypothetical protein
MLAGLILVWLAGGRSEMVQRPRGELARKSASVHRSPGTVNHIEATRRWIFRSCARYLAYLGTEVEPHQVFDAMSLR